MFQLIISFYFYFINFCFNFLVLFYHFFLKCGNDQVEIIKDLPADKTITVYRCGPLVDLCRGPHIPNTSFVKALACLKVDILIHVQIIVWCVFDSF